MSITIELEPETEAWLHEQAKRENREPAQFVRRLLHRAKNGNGISEKNNGTSFEAALASLRNRTPEQIAEARAQVLAQSRRAKPLPPGKTLEDMVFGKWPGEETDEEVRAALEAVS